MLLTLGNPRDGTIDASIPSTNHDTQHLTVVYQSCTAVHELETSMSIRTVLTMCVSIEYDVYVVFFYFSNGGYSLEYIRRLPIE
jgi:hypothetical protein